MLSKGIARVALRQQCRSIGTRSLHAGDGTADDYKRVRLNPSLLKYTGDNTNVASHNAERRAIYTEDFNFYTTFNMGVEGFSHCHFSQDMDPLRGHKNEWVWLFGLLLLVPLLARGRKDNEDAIAGKLGNATNRYSQMQLDEASADLSSALKH
jgi:hypothetical protein